MIVIYFIMRNQIMIGMLLSLFLFVSFRKRRKFFALRAVCSAAAALCLFEFVPIPLPFSLLVYFIAIALVVWICFRCNIKQVLFSATCAYCVQHITSKITYVMMMAWMHFDFVYVTYNYPLLSLGVLLLVNALVCIPIYLIWTRRVIRNQELNFDNFKILIYTAAFLLCAVFLSFYTERALAFGSRFYLIGYISLNGLCVLFAWIVLTVNFANCRDEILIREKRMLEQLLKKDRQQYEAAKQNMERINIHYHDIKKRRGMAMDPEEAQKLDEEIKNFKKLYYSGNEVVDITLAEKASQCAEAGIQFICSVDGGCLNRIKSYQIYSLLGNAIDNAIEALRTVTDEEKKVIRLDIFEKGKMSVIRVTNYIANKPKMADGIPVTTKRDNENHGFGIKSIRNIAEEYGGMMYISTDNHTFGLVVVIPASEAGGPDAQ